MTATELRRAKDAVMTTQADRVLVSDANRWFRHKDWPRFVAYSLNGLDMFGYPLLCFDLDTCSATVSPSDTFMEIAFAPVLRGPRSEFVRLTSPPRQIDARPRDFSVAMPPYLYEVGSTFRRLRFYLSLEDGRPRFSPTPFVIRPSVVLAFSDAWIPGRDA